MSPVLLADVSLRALERGGLSSCLRNALKMRSTEHFPNSPQFTFSTFSLGCQAFVVIFINSNCWLFPFLPGKTPPPLELATTLWQASHGAGFALLLLNTPFSPRPFHSRRPHSHCLRCVQCHPNSCSQATHLSKLLPSTHRAHGLQYGAPSPPLTCSVSSLPCPPRHALGPDLLSGLLLPEHRLTHASRPGEKPAHREGGRSLEVGLHSMEGKAGALTD